MSVRKAQNRIRKRHGVGKGKLHKRMSAARADLSGLADQAQWPRGWSGTFNRRRDGQRMHDLVDQLVADSVISRAYLEAEIAAIEVDARKSLAEAQDSARKALRHE